MEQSCITYVRNTQRETVQGMIAWMDKRMATLRTIKETLVCRHPGETEFVAQQRPGRFPAEEIEELVDAGFARFDESNPDLLAVRWIRD